jgi:hypothetical protein
MGKINKTQQLEISDFQEWLISNEALYAAEGTRKKLTVTMNGGYNIYHNGEIVYQCMQPYSAIEKYNSI